ncbi:MAG: ROK family protein [Anaerolineae bacterium]|nr:ROK family protein [Anaerolineae bacterium]
MAYRFAVDIGATRTMLALIDEHEPEIIAHERPNTDVLFTGRRPPGMALAGAILHFLRERGVSPTELEGVGVGVPGQVDRENGTVLSCPNLHVLDGAALGPEASAELGVPVYIDNNTNLISLGEHTAGVGKGVEDMAVVFVGSGVGCGLILNGELYEGADGVAAEFGHTKVVPNGLLCTCGGHGCLEMYCSGKALTLVAEQIFKPRDLYALGTRFAGAQLLIEQARAGHAQAREALTEAFIYLGVGLTSLVNLLNPRMIVLGGGIVFAWPEGVDVARDFVMKEALPGARRHLRIEISQLQNYAGVLGGAALVSTKGRAAPHIR